MPILAWPAAVPDPNTFTLGLKANTQSGGRSPFDGTEQTLELPGARWVAELRFQNLAINEWRGLTAFVASLGGQAGRFTWSPVSKFPRRGPSAGTPVVSGAGQTGKVLVTSGWSGATAFLAGDYLGYVDPTGRSVMHIVTADAPVTTGVASVAIAPAIRRSPANAASINRTTFSPVWRLAEDVVMADYEPGDRGISCTLQIEESLW